LGAVPHAVANRQRLHYLRRGSGEPLLLIQGLSGNHLHWGERFLSELEPAFETIAYDHRGIGLSDPAPAGYTIADLADDAAALLQALDLQSVHVMGVSMGGMVAQELALRAPQRVRTLTLGATYAGGPGSVRTDPAVVQRLGQLFMAGRVGDAMRELIRFNVSERFASDPANLEPFAQIAAQLPASMDVLMAQFQAVGGHDTSARLERIAAPTLVVHGSDDRILPVANAHAIAARVPGARLEIVDGVGHLFWWERPERSAQLVRELAQAAPARQ
jgi:pimeloyl-ACP methyl ester carboxylesterase